MLNALLPSDLGRLRDANPSTTERLDDFEDKESDL